MDAPPSLPVELTNRVLIRLAGVLSSSADWPYAELDALGDAAPITALALKHGLGPALFPTLPAQVSALSPEKRSLWQRLAMVQFAKNAALFARLEELAAELTREQIPALLFKGGAAMLWAYEDRDRRDLGDFDLLIHPEHVAAVRVLMARLGYVEVTAYSSPEEEQLGIERVHLPPFIHPDRTVIEVHVNVLERRGNREVATPEIWRDSALEELAGAPLRRMSWEHFLLQTAVHYTRHLEEDFAPLKGLADMLVVVRRFGAELDWPELWHTAERWEITLPVARICCTLQEHWGLPIPGLPTGAEPLSLTALATGSCPDLSGPTNRSLERVAAASELPDLASRCRYLFRLAFPEPDHLRWRYRLPEDANVSAYYLRYPVDRLRGLWRGRKPPEG